MRRFLSVWMLVSGLLVAGGASAASVTWTIPPTAITGSGTYTSVSGTFEWDALNQVVSNVNVTLVVSGTGVPLTSSSANFGQYIVLNNASPTTGVPVVFIDGSNLTNTANPTTVGYIFAGACVANAGNCINIRPVSSASNVTLTPYVAPAPTVSSVNPTSGTTAGGTPITITGTNFANGATVNVGTAACTNVNVVSATSITCTTPSGTAGQVNVEVTVGAQASAVNTLFTYTAPTPPAPPQPIPTLSEWAQIMMMLMMIATAGFYGWRMKQR